LPVVCHRHGGYADWIVSGKNGFLFSTEDEARKILDQLIANPSLRRSVGANTRQTIENMYTGDKMEERLQFYVASKPPIPSREPVMSVGSQESGVVQPAHFF
jgi:glycosyltransferase involved in cell wall biosynthesis